MAAADGIPETRQAAVEESDWVCVSYPDIKLGGRMAVKRIVANIATDQVEDAKAFYADILGLNLVMDLGWILTFAAGRHRSALRPREDRARQYQTSPSRWIISTRSIISMFSLRDQKGREHRSAGRPTARSRKQ
jgi:hypothetical protein